MRTAAAAVLPVVVASQSVECERTWSRCSVVSTARLGGSVAWSWGRRDSTPDEALIPTARRVGAAVNRCARFELLPGDVSLCICGVIALTAWSTRASVKRPGRLVFLWGCVLCRLLLQARFNPFSAGRAKPCPARMAGHDQIAVPHQSHLAVAQGLEHRLSDSKDVTPTATVRVPPAYSESALMLRRALGYPRAPSSLSCGTHPK